MNDLTAAARAARFQVRRALAEMAMRPVAADHPDPLEALRVLRELRGAVTLAEREAARRAREDGRSWREIGTALGVDGPPSAAFTHVMPPYRGVSPDWFIWTCGECGEHVRDYGPGLWPDEAEKGHVRTCPRLAATVAAYEDGSGEGSGDGLPQADLRAGPAVHQMRASRPAASTPEPVR